MYQYWPIQVGFHTQGAGVFTVYLLTLHVPLPPDDVVEADLVMFAEFDALKILPFRGCQFATATQEREDEIEKNTL